MMWGGSRDGLTTRSHMDSAWILNVLPTKTCVNLLLSKYLNIQVLNISAGWGVGCAETLFLLLLFFGDGSQVHAMRKGRPSLRGGGSRGGGGGWSYIHSTEWSKKKEERTKPLCCQGSERASLSGRLYFFQCDFSLPPSQSASASLGWGVCVLKGNPSGLSEVGVLQVR